MRRFDPRPAAWRVQRAMEAYRKDDFQRANLDA